MNLVRGRVARSRSALTTYPRAADAMVRALRVVPSWTPVATLLPGARRGAVYPVLDASGALVGILDFVEVAARPDLHDCLAGEVCRPAHAMSVLGPEDRVGPDAVPGLVVDCGRLIGILPARPGRSSVLPAVPPARSAS
jgi:hypothetical protein